MALDLDQQLWLEALFEEAELRPSKLSEWELNFVDDHRSRYAEHGSEMFLSVKQRDVLERIEKKLGL